MTPSPLTSLLSAQPAPAGEFSDNQLATDMGAEFTALLANLLDPARKSAGVASETLKDADLHSDLQGLIAAGMVTEQLDQPQISILGANLLIPAITTNAGAPATMGGASTTPGLPVSATPEDTTAPSGKVLPHLAATLPGQQSALASQLNVAALEKSLSVKSQSGALETSTEAELKSDRSEASPVSVTRKGEVAPKMADILLQTTNAATSELTERQRLTALLSAKTAPSMTLDQPSSTQSPASPSAAPLPISVQPADTAPIIRPTLTTTAFDLGNVIDKLVEAQQAARPGRANIALTHDDFGRVSVRLDQMAGASLNVSMVNADPGFAPAVQASLIERAVAERLAPNAEQTSARGDTSTQGQGHDNQSAGQQQTRTDDAQRTARTDNQSHDIDRDIAAPSRDDALFA